MRTTAPSVEAVNLTISKAKQAGIIQLSTTDEFFDGRHLTTNNQFVHNFGSCSYLGLELDERLKAAAIDAVERYGTQFSSSRAYMSIGLYDELENLLEQIFGYPTIVAPTTTLGHLSNIPVLVGPKDAVILDHQVHASVQQAVRLVSTSGVHVEMVRHNNLEALENRIIKLKDKYEKIWYMADGIYSMFGDGAPMQELYELMNSYEQFHLYVDDAHGISWEGKHGAGYVMSQVPMHPKMYLTASLAKAFGACGGVMVYPDQATKDLVRNCGSTLMFSGPIQPGTLGAAVASAKIHLTDEIYDLQANLKGKMDYYVQVATELGLPLVKYASTPIFFIGVGKPEVGYDLCKKVLDSGFYTNLAVYPSVPYNNTGLRMTLTCHHTKSDIKHLLMTISNLLDSSLKRTDYTRADIFRAFKMKSPAEQLVSVAAAS